MKAAVAACSLASSGLHSSFILAMAGSCSPLIAMPTMASATPLYCDSTCSMLVANWRPLSVASVDGATAAFNRATPACTSSCALMTAACSKARSASLDTSTRLRAAIARRFAALRSSMAMRSRWPTPLR